MQNPHEDTEWNDALRAQGILPPKPADIDAIAAEAEEAATERAIARDEAARREALQDDELEDELLREDDEEEARAVAAYRAKRMAEMRQAARGRDHFGSVQPLARSDWTRDVTEARGLDKGTAIVVVLYDDSITQSRRLMAIMHEFARAFPHVKVLAIPATQAIEGYPARNVPTLLIYRDGSLLDQIVTCSSMGGADARLRDVQARLARLEIVPPPQDGDSESD